MKINDLDQHLDHDTSHMIHGGVYTLRRSALSSTRFQSPYLTSNGTADRSSTAPAADGNIFSIPNGIIAVGDSGDVMADITGGNASTPLDQQDKNN